MNYAITSETISTCLKDSNIINFLGEPFYSKSFGKLMGGIFDDPSVEKSLTSIPSETTIEERRFLYNIFRHFWSGEGNVFEVGPFLGGTTRAIALGMMANKKFNPQSKIKTYDCWDYGDLEFLKNHLNPFYVSGVISPENMNNILNNPTQKNAFYNLHKDHDYFSIIETYESILPQTKDNLSDSNILTIAPDSDINSFFIDGCKSWYGTKYFFRQSLRAAKLGALFIFQDYAHHTCFWVPYCMHFLKENFNLIGYLDSTYCFQLKNPIDPELVERVIPDTPEELGRAKILEVYQRMSYEAALRSDFRGVVLAELQYAAVLAYIGEKSSSLSIIMSLLEKPWAIQYKGTIERAKQCPTYRPEGVVSLVP